MVENYGRRWCNGEGAFDEEEEEEEEVGVEPVPPYMWDGRKWGTSKTDLENTWDVHLFN